LELTVCHLPFRKRRERIGHPFLSVMPTEVKGRGAGHNSRPLRLSRRLGFMERVQRQLRLVQIGCLSVLVACAVLAHWQARKTGGSSSGIGTLSIVMIMLALWSAVSGFTLQRKFQRRPQTSSSKSTPFTRWRAGHIFRLWTATTSGVWALLLFEFHGPLWISDLLFGFAILLLLIWKPDAAPALGETTPVNR
jgi:hypothetical protein